MDKQNMRLPAQSIQYFILFLGNNNSLHIILLRFLSNPYFMRHAQTFFFNCILCIVRQTTKIYLVGNW